MTSFLLKRLLQAFLVMFAISIIGFLVQNNFGDPLRELVGQSVSEAERDKLRDELGLNDPFWTQYKRFALNAVQGDFGTSYFFKKNSLEVILAKFPATFELFLTATFFVILISFPLGLFCAIKPNHFLSHFLMAGSIIGISIPVFLSAIFGIYLFSVTLGWLPSFGRGDTVLLPWGWETGFLSLDGLKHLLMPSVILSSIMIPLFIRLIRAEMREQLLSDYVRYATSKGLSKNKIWIRHAFRNTLLPIITVGGIQIGIMIAYTILTETVFQWPGMGFLFLEAVHRVDTPLIIAYIIFIGFVFIVVNTLVDLLYFVVNPTLRKMNY
jgi:peptide/nickel transport system permease protein